MQAFLSLLFVSLPTIHHRFIRHQSSGSWTLTWHWTPVYLLRNWIAGCPNHQKHLAKRVPYVLYQNGRAGYPSYTKTTTGMSGSKNFPLTKGKSGWVQRIPYSLSWSRKGLELCRIFLSHSFRFELPISTFSVSLELKMHDLHCRNILWLQFLSSNFHLGTFPSTPLDIM